MNSFPSNPENPGSSRGRASPLRRATNPLHQLLGTHADVDTLTPDQLSKLRRLVIHSLPEGSAWGLDRFLEDLFSDPAMVIAYFRPTTARGAGRQALQVLPFVPARKAADRSRLASVLLPADQMVAWVATFLAPCAIFYSADPRLGLRMHGLDPQQALVQLRADLLDRAMYGLRRGNAGVGNLLAAVLDLPRSGDCSGQQVARIKTAVCLNLIPIQRVWTGVLLS